MRRLWIILGAAAVASGVAAAVVERANSGYIKVATAKAIREDLVSVVSGSGEIEPKNFVNIGATAFGRITHLYVKEGDRVKRGQILASIDDIQAQANVAAQQAGITSARTDIASFAAAEATAQASVAHAKADLQQKQLDWRRAQALYQDQLIAKQDFDSKRAAYDTAVASLAESNAELVQARAQTASARGKYDSAIAMLRSDYDTLNKTVSYAPFDGVVTNVPVREGETVVVGIQNAEGSTLMTLADLSVITAEVNVDETDIVNVTAGQRADVTADAIPGKVFRGVVTGIGDQAILRSTGIATSQSTAGAEEAKDFKVIVTLKDPSPELRPGLSTTAKIITARRDDVLSIPIQALTLRSARKAAGADPPTGDPEESDQGEQGVFILRKVHGRLEAMFQPVKTGITGAMDIEVTGGLQPGDEIVIGPYKVLRALKNGARVKRDDSGSALSDGDESSP